MTLNSYDQTIAAYHDPAHELAERYDALPSGAAFHALQPLFPSSGLALDVGAGSAYALTWHAVPISIKTADAAFVQIVIRFRAAIHLPALPLAATTGARSPRRHPRQRV
jgi:hypothetical protein